MTLYQLLRRNLPNEHNATRPDARKPEEAVMLQTVSRLLPELPLFLMTALATHLVMSFAQTLMHYKLGHHPIGGKFLRNHINFHHAHYSKDHLVSRTYLSDHGNNTPFFFIPVFLVGACTYLVLPVDLFVAQLVACAASFYAHVFFDKPHRGIAASAICMVQTETGAAFRSSPAREQQFRGDPFLLG